MRVATFLGRGAVAVAAAALPLVLSQSTAGANPSDTHSATIHFYDYSSPPQSVTCTLYADASVQQDRSSLSAEVQIQGPYDPRCAAALRVEVSYEGDDGEQHVAVATGNGYQASVSVDHVSGAVHVKNRATFFSCNAPYGGCTLNVETNPK